MRAMRRLLSTHARSIALRRGWCHSAPNERRGSSPSPREVDTASRDVGASVEATIRTHAEPPRPLRPDQEIEFLYFLPFVDPNIRDGC